jgi:hypothetical protein
MTRTRTAVEKRPLRLPYAPFLDVEDAVTRTATEAEECAAEDAAAKFLEAPLTMVCILQPGNATSISVDIASLDL